MEVESDSRAIALEPGTRLLIRQQGREVRPVVVVQVKSGLIWISKLTDPGEDGDRVTIEYSVAGDGVYTAPARIERVVPETYALRRVGKWSRLQRRAHVRVELDGVEATIWIEDEARGPGGPQGFPARIEDLSAGGLRALTTAALAPGDTAACRFSLAGGDSGEHEFELMTRVVRCHELRGGRRRLGLEFMQVDPSMQSLIVRWTFREQIRKHRR